MLLSWLLDVVSPHPLPTCKHMLCRMWSIGSSNTDADCHCLTLRVWHCLVSLRAPVQGTCSLHPLGATSHADRFLEALQSLQPSNSPAQQNTPGVQEWQPTSSASPNLPFDLGSLIAAVAPLQQPLRSNTAAAQHMHGGVLTPISNSSSSSSNTGSSVKSSEPQQLLRVVLVYCRSKLPAPVWHVHKQAGLAIDCLHVHDKPQPGEQQQQLQVWQFNSSYSVACQCTSLYHI